MYSNFEDMLISTVKEKLIEHKIVHSNENVYLVPHYRIVSRGKTAYHYIICCNYTNQKFFLKVSKEQDNAPHCNDYLKELVKLNTGTHYPVILIPEFFVGDTPYYITTYLEGYSLDKAPCCLFVENGKKISSLILKLLNELSAVHAPLYSESNTFTTSDCPTIFHEKIMQRMQHPVFKHYSKSSLGKVIARCNNILSESSFSLPTLLHMDIKPANIVYSPQTDSISLIDFEHSRFGDIDYGWTQVLLSGINSFREEYRKYIIPNLTEQNTSLFEAKKIPKYQCYLFYQTACNMIYYYDKNDNCPSEMLELFHEMLNTLLR